MSQLSRDRLDELAREFVDVGLRLGDPEVYADRERQITLAKRHAELEPIVAAIDVWNEATGELEAARQLQEEGGGDPELAEMARDAEQAVAAAEDALRSQLIPKDPDAGRPVLLEVRGAEGGEEANLFARELLDMYRAWAERHGWRFEVLSADASDMGGITGALVRVSGDEAWSRLQFEAGPHRVQRVPVTEAQGRVHTSSAVVTALVEADKVEVDIDPTELRVDTYRASGAGGQHVNKTESAVRITHEPTGVVVAMQDEKSQTQNRERAMVVLRSRLLALRRAEQAAEVAGAKRAQGGGGGRSEKIRTYNYKENRVTDHRIGLTVYSLDKVLAGDVDIVSDPLLADERARLLTEAT
ncbi:MAG: peptide chain release factor 1 [Microthrixaceae bacterium]